jgi:hypothetical protein
MLCNLFLPKKKDKMINNFVNYKITNKSEDDEEEIIFTIQNSEKSNKKIVKKNNSQSELILCDKIHLSDLDKSKNILQKENLFYYKKIYSIKNKIDNSDFTHDYDLMLRLINDSNKIKKKSGQHILSYKNDGSTHTLILNTN